MFDQNYIKSERNTLYNLFIVNKINFYINKFNKFLLNYKILRALPDSNWDNPNLQLEALPIKLSALKLDYCMIY